MEQPPRDPEHRRQNHRHPETLGDEEEVWYRRGENSDSASAIRKWLATRWYVCSCTGSPLGDDEDAWARP